MGYEPFRLMAGFAMGPAFPLCAVVARADFGESFRAM